MTENELPLFAWQPATASIVPFPMRRDVGRARRIAATVLKRTSPSAQQAEFERAAAMLADRLRRSGLTEDQVRGQIDQFTGAVNAELVRLQMRGQRERM